MSPIESHLQDLTRRAFIGRAAAGLGTLALGSLLNPQLLGSTPTNAGAWRGVVNPLHHAAKIRRVIYLYQAGFQYVELGYAAAVSYVLTLMIVAIAIVQKLLSGREVA